MNIAEDGPTFNSRSLEMYSLNVWHHGRFVIGVEVANC